MSDDLFDNAEIVSLDDTYTTRHCKYCNSQVYVSMDGEVQSPECSGECGESNMLENYEDYPSEINFD